MDMIVRIISFLGIMVSLCGIIFVFQIIIEKRKMQTANRGLEEYIKDKNFLLMKSDGINTIDTKNEFEMPIFSQESNILIGHK